jgi:hypothetical protein
MAGSLARVPSSACTVSANRYFWVDGPAEPVTYLRLPSKVPDREAQTQQLIVWKERPGVDRCASKKTEGKAERGARQTENR